ncbi:hypothetical protein [Serratia sp. D1N4]
MMKREILSSALDEALKMTSKGCRIKTGDFIQAAAKQGRHVTPEEVNGYILHQSGHTFRMIEAGRNQHNIYLMLC